MVNEHKLKNPQANYMCASACFFIFVAGVKRTTILGQVMQFSEFTGLTSQTATLGHWEAISHRFGQPT